MRRFLPLRSERVMEGVLMTLRSALSKIAFSTLTVFSIVITGFILLTMTGFRVQNIRRQIPREGTRKYPPSESSLTLHGERA